jgi:hypothetical protein
MFQLFEHKAKVLNHNTCMERHGEAFVLRSDLKLQVTCSAYDLEDFGHGLRNLLYRARHDGDKPAPQQGELLGATLADGSALRFPQLEPLSWDEEFPGYEAVITKGMGLAESIRLDKVTLASFVMEPLDGGSVRLTFRATSHPSTLTSGELDGVQQKEIELSLLPPKPEKIDEQTSMDLDDDSAAPVAPRVDHVLVKGIELKKKRNQLTEAIATASDGQTFHVGEWAADPTIDQVAAALFDELGFTVEFTPAAREAYAQRKAA